MLVLTLSMLAFAEPAIDAAKAPQPAPVAAPSGAPPVHKATYSEEMICKVVIPMGSLVGRKKVCAPRGDWEQVHSDARENIYKIQNLRSY